MTGARPDAKQSADVMASATRCSSAYADLSSAAAAAGAGAL